MYVFIVESFFNYLYNFFTGGQLVCMLAAIPGVYQLDALLRAFAAGKWMSLIFGLICAIWGAGFAMFNRKHIGLLVRLATGEQLKPLEPPPGKKLELLKLTAFSLANFSIFLMLSLYPLLFYYVMTVFGRAVEGISERSTGQTGNKQKEKIVFCYKKILFFCNLQ